MSATGAIMAEPMHIAQIDIALGFDASYAPHAAAAIASVMRHAPGINVRFILLHAGVTRPQQERVERAVPNARFVWTEVGEKDLPDFATRGHFNRAILFRIGLETLAPADCKRVLYIDSDTTVMHDVRELWASDLKGAPLGAVIDHYNNPVEWAQKWSLPAENARYFNSGVLLIDLAKVRTEKLFSRALDFFVRNDKELLMADQDALNYAAWNRWTALDPAWNVQRFMTPAEFAAQPAERQVKNGAPKLVHFIGWEKPWLPNKWHPWAWAYWQNLSRTPFAGDVRRTNHMDLFQLAKLRLRWWLKHPRTAS
jgi:lipopolysaccharide biosynthesis glycosyltransferase